MRLGSELTIRRVLVSANAMAIVAEVLRDANPIHLDPTAVEALGLGNRVINQGPANVAYVLDMLAGALPKYRLERIESRFLANVRDGDIVSAGGKVSAMEFGKVTCDVWLALPDGALALTGRAFLTEF